MTALMTRLLKGQPIIVNDSSENITANFRGLWTPTASDSVEFQAGVSDSDLGIGERGSTLIAIFSIAINMLTGLV